MGPVPIIAVKQGEKDIKYDLEFVYSEVNADEKFVILKYGVYYVININVGFTSLMGRVDTS